MKLIVQTLKNVKYPLDISDNSTVAEAKIAIEKQHSLATPETMKLIFKGKILKNEESLISCGVKENDALVLMISVKKPATDSFPASSSSSSSSTSAATAASSPAATSSSSSAPLPASLPTPSSSAATNAASSSTSAALVASTANASIPAASSSSAVSAVPSVSSSSSLLQGPAYEEAVTNLMSFGYSREQVIAALQSAYFNPDRAAEYLFSGIPAHAMQPQIQRAPAAPSSAASSSASSSASASASSSSSSSAMDSSLFPAARLAAGANQEQPDQADVSELRALLAANPQALPHFIATLARTQPELMQMMEDDPQQFLAVLQHLGVDPMSLPGLQALQAGAGVARDGVGRQVIEINEEERAQIENLMSLGFSRDQVLEAWITCDRNAEIAASYLLEHGADVNMAGENGFEFDDGAGGGGGGNEDDDDDEADFDPSNYSME